MANPNRVQVGRWVVDADLPGELSASSLSEADYDAVYLENHYRLLLLDADATSRLQLYNEAYATLFAQWPPEDVPDRGVNERIISMIRPWLADRDVLELGCGAGGMAAAVAELTRSFVGVDVDPKQLAVAHARAPRATFVQGTAPDLTLPFARYDVVYCNDFFEHLHVEDQASLIVRVRDALRPEGWLILISPNARFGPWDISRTFRLRGQSARGLHLGEQSYIAWKGMLREAGFRGRTLSPIIPARFTTSRRTWLDARIKGYLERLPLPARVAGGCYISAVILAVQR